ncbi:hypothetical protein EB001_27585 [bacterium]|nr:hypothetical protein [bacterium]
MKSFLEHLDEAKGTKTLNIFDIDDTLFMSSAKTAVVKNGKVLHKLDTRELLNYKLKPGEKFDYSEFKSGKHFYDTATPIEKMIRRAQQAVHGSENSRTIIITARADLSDKDLFLKKFKEHGFPIDQVHVERAGNVKSRGTNSPLSKAVVIRKYIATGLYSRIRMWDDHPGNLSMLLKLAKLHPEITFEAYLVNSESGTSTRYTG